MKFTDEKGKELTHEEVIAKGMGHLLPDAPAVVCDTCGRKSWSNEPGDACNMTQPTGRKCSGIFVLP